jgi:anti-sigma B factor antagonist
VGMDVAVTTGATHVVVHLEGELDLATAPALAEALNGLDASGGPVVVDLTDVGFLDSSGLSTLLQARQRLADDGRGAELRLVVTRPSILRVLDVTGLADVFAVYDSVDGATSPA